MRFNLREFFERALPQYFGKGDARKPKTIVILMDGTLSRLDPGMETNVGQTKRFLEQIPDEDLRVFYEPGLQWASWRSAWDLMTGRGTSGKILQAYRTLAQWYQPGDKVFLIGFSRGAYAVRSLAGLIEHVGLLRHEDITPERVDDVWKRYRNRTPQDAEFTADYCHANVPIQAIGAWDTVKALGIPVPVLWYLTRHRHQFHNHALGPSTKAGFHALALDETRAAYVPVMWDTSHDWRGHVEQMWFMGTHGEVGGQITMRPGQRPLSNIPLQWMLDRLQSRGLPLPDGWRDAIPTDPSLRTLYFRGAYGLIISRFRRRLGRDASEQLHPTVPKDHRAQKYFKLADSVSSAKEIT